MDSLFAAAKRSAVDYPKPLLIFDFRVTGAVVPDPAAWLFLASHFVSMSPSYSNHNDGDLSVFSRFR
jgi:hypothetical protein